jgi:single-strand DNA-binding protein
MSIGQTPITVIGNLCADPELRYTSTGTPVATFTVASTKRALNKETGKYEDSGTLFLRVNCWRHLAENVAESAQKGVRVVVSGSLNQRDWEDKEGNKRTSYEVQAEEVAASMQWATCKITKTERSHGNGPVQEDPWAEAGPPPAPAEDEPPF